MTVREIILNDIVEDIETYKNIYSNFINFLKEDIDENYQPSFSFDEFCIKMMNNFEGVDDDFQRFLTEQSKHPLTGRLMKSLMSIAFEEFKENKDSVKKLQQIFYLNV